MNYTASVFDFFKSPKWGMNMLYGGICILIPIIGPIVLMGWHVGGMYGRSNWRDFEGYPLFDFGKFGQMMERGVWPFLVQLVMGLVMVPVLLLVMGGPMMGMMAVLPEPNRNSATPDSIPPEMLAMLGLMILGYVCVVGLMVLVSKPLMIRAAMVQDFGKSFSWAFMKSFIAKTWLQQIASLVFVIFAAMVLMMIGMVACFIGMYFTMSIIFFAQWHLDRQLYELYLARGGEPVEVSAKIRDVPPVLPAS